MNTQTKEPEDKLASAKAQGQAQFDSIKEMVDALEAARKAALDDTWAGENEKTIEDAAQQIHEDALSVEVRSAWHVPGNDASNAEYNILLCTGGPACRIIGELGEHGEPETARLEVQDWFQPWTQIRPLVAKGDYNSEPILLAYARCFYFGE